MTIPSDMHQTDSVVEPPPISGPEGTVKRLAIIQSNYIPWKGYFDLIHMADELILYDDVQYTKNDWRNRNRIKTPQGTQWLTIPVHFSGNFGQRIRDARTVGSGWRSKHWRTLEQNYRRTPFFERYAPVFKPIYLESSEESLSMVNRALIEAVCGILGVRTRISWSWEHDLGAGKSERLLRACQSVGADEYLSGPAARGYLDVGLFERHGVSIRWMDYSGYPEYAQPHPPFDHAVTALDAIFSLGHEATRVMKSFPPRPSGAHQDVIS